MSKQKVYFKWDLPRDVVGVVVGICVGYGRRERAIRQETVAGAVRARYVELNAIVDCAMEEIEAGLRREILDDMTAGRGYCKSAAQYIVGKDTYYRRRNKLIHDVAKALDLI